MITWLAANAATIIISLILAGVVVAVIVKMVRDKKSGKLSCGCGCANCAMKDTCHSGKK